MLVQNIGLDTSEEFSKKSHLLNKEKSVIHVKKYNLHSTYLKLLWLAKYLLVKKIKSLNTHVGIPTKKCYYKIRVLKCLKKMR